MKNRTLLLTVSTLFITLFSCGQDTSVVNSSVKIITHRGEGYEINGEKVRRLSPLLMTYKESAYEYKIARKNSVIGVSCLGFGLAALTASLFAKSDETRKFVGLYVEIPALIGLVYFSSRVGKHMRRSIQAYNETVTKSSN